MRTYGILNEFSQTCSKPYIPLIFGYSTSIPLLFKFINKTSLWIEIHRWNRQKSQHKTGWASEIFQMYHRYTPGQSESYLKLVLTKVQRQIILLRLTLSSIVQGWESWEGNWQGDKIGTKTSTKLSGSVSHQTSWAVIRVIQHEQHQQAFVKH